MPASKTHSPSNSNHMDRKSKKPLMEKKRRARINHCLSDLKNLLLEYLKKDPAHTSKLEKADILEMTVHLLKTLQDQQLAMAASLDKTVIDRFQHGYVECFMQVKRYAETVEAFDAGVRERMLRHLDMSYRNLRQKVSATQLLPPARLLQPQVSHCDHYQHQQHYPHAQLHHRLPSVHPQLFNSTPCKDMPGAPAIVALPPFPPMSSTFVPQSPNKLNDTHSDAGSDSSNIHVANQNEEELGQDDLDAFDDPESRSPSPTTSTTNSVWRPW